MTEETKVIDEALNRNYMLANMEIRLWSGKKTDRDVAEQVITSAGAVRGSGVFIKDLFAGADTELEAVRSAYSAIRLRFYSETLPWNPSQDGLQRGSRIIAAERVIQFLVTYNKMKQQAEAVRADFQAKLPGILARLPGTLSGLYKPSDYPAVTDLLTLFNANLVLQPMPSMSDYSRYPLPAKLVGALSAKYERDALASVANAKQAMYTDTLKYLQRMSIQMGKVVDGEKTRLYESMIGNLKHQVGMLRAMNVDADPVTKQLADDIEKQLTGYEIEAIKDNVALARTLGNSATALANTLAPLVPNAPPPPAAKPRVPKAQPASKAEPVEDKLEADVDALVASFGSSATPQVSPAPPAPKPTPAPVVQAFNSGRDATLDDDLDIDALFED